MNPIIKSRSRYPTIRLQTRRTLYGYYSRKSAIGSDAHPAEDKDMISVKRWGDYLTTTEASEYLRRSASWLLCQKDIPYLPGHPNTYKRLDLDAWYEENKRKPLMG